MLLPTQSSPQPVAAWPELATHDALAQQIPSKLLTSYAENFEDVLLHRVFANVDRGFYVDVGAGDPITGSVTKSFYDRGWSGVNVEPASVFDELRLDRPRDVNLNIAILDHGGTVAFIEDSSEPALSHVASAAETAQAEQGWRRSVQCERLDQVLVEHAAGRLINFLKIDVAGAEERIVTSTDWRRVRPQVLIVAVVAPSAGEVATGSWESAVLAAGYKRAYFDGLNLFFVAEEVTEFLRHFDRPVNVRDGFETYRERVHKDKARQVLDALNHMRWELAVRLERVTPKLRGAERMSTSGDAKAQQLPEPDRLIREFDAALSALLRFQRVSESLSRALRKRQRLINAAAAVPDEELTALDPDEMLKELERAIEAAIRCDYIVGRLEDPGRLRSLRLALPVARLARSIGNMVLRRGAASKFAEPIVPHRTVRSTFKNIPGVIFRAIQRLAVAIVLPVTNRVRAYLLAPLLPMVEKIDATSREVAAVRDALDAARVEGQLSPQLAQSIEALLLSMAVRTPRD
jgi:FkbM family methyltransferase